MIEWSNVDFVGFIYAVIVFIGGLIGYIKAGSIPSIVAASIFGILICVGAYFNSCATPRPIILLVVALILALFMGYRFWNSGKFMPAGLVTILSVVVIVWTSIYYRAFLPFVGTSSTTIE